MSNPTKSLKPNVAGHPANEAETQPEVFVRSVPKGPGGQPPPRVPQTLQEGGSPPPAGPPHLPEVGRERYEVDGEFARGGIGRVLRAQDLHLGRTVALKELLTPGGSNEVRFVSEALVTARLQHPSIVPIYEAGRWPTGEPFYAMKLVSGRSLSKLIAEAPTLPERLALLPHVLAVAEAMAYAHSQGIIHRDLKPANILVGEFGETVVIDWGLAKALWQPDEPVPPPQPPPREVVRDDSPRTPGSSDLTQAGMVVGTPAYMPPEQAAGLKVDERADVYALGAILYNLLAGARPYDHTNPQEVLRQVAVGALVPLARRQKGIPEELLAIVAKAMARNAGERYPTARELAEDLRRFQTGQLVGAHRYSPLDRLRRYVRRYRAAVAVAAVAIAVWTVGGVVSLRRIVAERDLAQAARREAIVQSDEHTLLHAREALEQDPNEALGWLKTLSPTFGRWGAVRVLAADARTRGLATLLRGHTQLIGSLAFSPDGRLLATASDDRTVRLWDLESGESRVLTGHTDEVWRLAFSPDGRHLASGGRDKTVRLWDVVTGTARVFSGNTDGVMKLFFSPDGGRLVSGDRSGTVVSWDLATGSSRSLKGLDGRSYGFALSPDGRLLATTSQDQGTVLLWDLVRGESRPLTGHHAPLFHVVFSPRGDVFATAGREAEIRLWRIQDGESRVLAGHRGVISGLAFSPDGRTLASAGSDATVRLWDPNTGEARVLEGHRGQESPLAFSPDGRLLACGGQDRTVRLWDVATGQDRTLRGYEEAIQTLAFSPDSRLLAAGDASGSLRVFQMSANAGLALIGHEGAVTSTDLSPDGKLIVSTGEDGTVRLWSRTGEVPRLLKGHQRGVVRAVFSPDGAWVASAGQDGTVRLWDTSGQLQQILEGQEKDGGRWSSPLAFSPDGALLATALADGGIRLRELDSGRERILAGHQRALRSLAFSPDGRRLASSGLDTTVRVWDVATGEGRVLGATGDSVRVVAFSPDGRHLASGGADHTLRFWDLESGESRRVETGGLGVIQIAFSPDGRIVYTLGEQEAVVRQWEAETGAPRGSPLRGHEDNVLRFALSPEGKRLATASADSTVRLWDLESGENRILRGHSDKVTWVVFSPDGNWVASSGQDGTVRLWSDDLPSRPGPLRAWLDAAATRGARVR